MSYDSKYKGTQVEDALGKALTAAQKADIPTKISDLDNDAGSISFLGIEYTLSDSDKVVSDVNEWVATSAPLTQRERAIVYGNGYYVVCGTSGDVAYSADLLVAVNVGSLGIIISSLASLITFREYTKHNPDGTLGYIKQFTAFNFGILAILVAFMLII